MTEDDRVAVVERIVRSAKYRALDRAFVERIVTDSMTGRSPRLAEKEARSRLHQAYGAFLAGRPARAVARACAEVEAEPGRHPEAWRDAMRAHRSTVERAPHLERFGELVGQWCGTVTSVVDIAGGLGALMIPWLPIDPGGSYRAIDIDADVAAALGGLDRTMPVDVRAECIDVVGDAPAVEADLCLLLKAVPTFEAQRAGASTDAIARITARHVILSFPCRSLGGRRQYGVDPRELAGDAVAGTRFVVVADERLGDEHYVHCVPDR